MSKSQEMAKKLDALYKKLDALEEIMRNDAETAAALKKQIRVLEKDFVNAFDDDVRAGLI
jgi:protein-arginine kinase activator protein McsA